MELEEQIKPFFWIQHEKSYSVCLNVGEWMNEIFDLRQEEGFEGNGYDWGSLAQVFMDEVTPELKDIVNFDPEADMFVAYSADKEALKKFVIGFKGACENTPFIQDLFLRAELD